MQPRFGAIGLSFLGLLLLLAIPGSIAGYPVGEVSVGLGVAFLFIGLATLALFVFTDRDRPTFVMAVAISLGSVVAVFVTWILYLHHPGTALRPLELSWWTMAVGATPGVTIPVVAALVFALACVETAEERRLALGLLSIPLAVGVISFAINPAGFGFAFGFVVVGLLVLTGIFVGIPLYVFGEMIHADADLKGVIFSHLDFGSTPDAD